MPPHVPRKRLRDDSPERAGTPKKRGKTTATVTAPPRKATLFDDLDATNSPRTKNDTRKPPAESSDDDSSLTSLSDAEFEDLSIPQQQMANKTQAQEDDEDDEDMEFEDVAFSTLAPQRNTGLENGALELTLSHIPTASYTDFGGKKGPSKNERRIRVATHCMHVQFLMWHNSVRNSWLCDPTIQGIMLSHLPLGIWDEIDRFRRTSGIDKKDMPRTAAKGASNSKANKAKGKKSAKMTRDWGDAAERLEKGVVDMSFGDPLFRLLKALSSWWRKRFQVTAPGVRKTGYMETRRCTSLIKGFNGGGSDPKRYGERISSLQWFRLRAQECTGSRDVGAQLFTALLRAIGLEARMIANLQPTGFGFTKFEEADPEKLEEETEAVLSEKPGGKAKPPVAVAAKSSKTSKPKDTKSNKHSSQSGRSLRQNGRKNLKEYSDDSQDDDLAVPEESDDDSIIEIPALAVPKNIRSAKFDKDLEFPHYWTEVLSPATNKYVPVDAIVKNIVGTNRDLVESFEPRGAKADKAKQVMAYVVGFSDDGTAKDVTVRYLKQQLFPGRTKGMRMPIEKVPVYNKNGKVKRYDQFDWFKSVMRGYSRGSENHPLTDIDYDEETTDLKPAEPKKKEVKEGEETLQYYKQSKEFVLARHLKREEALLPTAQPVKVFKTKGKKGDGDEEPVYLRKDVVQVKSEETWHKQGRVPKPGVEPLKRAPYRAATTNRRRELAEAEALSGHKVLQGLYSHEQTDWIIPPPIQNGVIPKNQYGNIDLFVEHMLPEGAAHVPYRGAVRVCKRLEIDFAEAVVDFEFGHRMAVPVIQGVVVAEEYFDRVMEELAKDEAERKRKEDEKRRKVVLAMWRRLLKGLRIRERIRLEYGEVKEDYNVFGHSRDQQEAPVQGPSDDVDMAGGFLPEGYEDDDHVEEEARGDLHKSSFFPAVDEDEDEADGADEADGLVIEDGGPAPSVSSTSRDTETRHNSRNGPGENNPRRRSRRIATQDVEEENSGEEEVTSDGEEGDDSSGDDYDDDYEG